MPVRGDLCGEGDPLDEQPGGFLSDCSSQPEERVTLDADGGDFSARKLVEPCQDATSLFEPDKIQQRRAPPEREPRRDAVDVVEAVVAHFWKERLSLDANLFMDGF